MILMVYQPASLCLLILVVDGIGHEDGCRQDYKCLAIGINSLIVEVQTPKYSAVNTIYDSYYRLCRLSHHGHRCHQNGQDEHYFPYSSHNSYRYNDV